MLTKTGYWEVDNNNRLGIEYKIKRGNCGLGNNMKGMD